MKIVIIGDNHKGMFSTLANWFSACGHQAVFMEKFGPRGNPADCDQSPIERPDIILTTRYILWEELPLIGISNIPKRVFYNLGNKNISHFSTDWRVESFNDYYASYNPMHAFYKAPSGAPNKYINLRTLPLPFYADLPHVDYSNTELKFCQALSNLAMANAYGKNTGLLTSACKQAGVPCELIMEKPTEEALAIKKNSPATFDNLMGMFGVSTLESMKFGQATVCYVETPILDKYEQLLGMRPPIIQAATYDELVEVLIKMKSGEINWRQIGLDSRTFMQNHFNPGKIVKCYIDYFTEILGG